MNQASDPQDGFIKCLLCQGQIKEKMCVLRIADSQDIPWCLPLLSVLTPCFSILTALCIIKQSNINCVQVNCVQQGDELLRRSLIFYYRGVSMGVLLKRNNFSITETTKSG